MICTMPFANSRPPLRCACVCACVQELCIVCGVRAVAVCERCLLYRLYVSQCRLVERRTSPA